MPEEHRINIMEDGAVPTENPEDLIPKEASVQERFIALLLDIGLIIFLYDLFLLVIVRIVDFDLAGIYKLLAGVNVPFILYETIWSCGGRSTLGKKLVGIRVADKDTGEPLGFVRAFVRTIGYYVSAALLLCGFLLAFIDDRHRALHDYFAGSVVVQSRPKSWVEKTVLSIAGVVLLALFCGAFYQQMFGGGSWAQKRLIMKAQKHVEKIAYLEDLHLVQYGYYTNDLLRLSILSGDPVQFQRDTQKVLDRKGFRIGIGPKGYKITARAKDAKKTFVTFPKN